MPDATHQLLGHPCLLRPGEPPQPLTPTRAHQVLAVLAVLGWLGSGGAAAPAQGWVRREWLAALIWPERSGAQARANLRKVLLQLRSLVRLEEGREVCAGGPPATWQTLMTLPWARSGKKLRNWA